MTVRCHPDPTEVPTSELVDSLREHLHGTDDSSHECQMVAAEPALAVMVMVAW